MRGLETEIVKMKRNKVGGGGGSSDQITQFIVATACLLFMCCCCCFYATAAESLNPCSPAFSNASSVVMRFEQKNNLILTQLVSICCCS